ncbi:MAG: aspartate kinase [Bdellovibrionales bacterium]|nr:aspartate kinase [Bdellovibrionales bacterium]
MIENLRVQKYGGSSLDSIEKIKSIAKQISSDYHKGDRFLLVVSAMGKTTDNLMQMAHQMSQNPNQRELDMLLTAGERISMALMGLALNELNIPCISFTGSQAGIMTCGTHGDASILEVKPIRVSEALQQNRVVIIAGFQGVDPKTKDVTTLGRGGSDTTAIAMASHFQCAKCEFKKDTEGVFDKDPNTHGDAIHRPEVSWDEIIELTEQGAPFLHVKAARMAKELNMPLEISHAHKPQGLKTLVQ